MIEQSAYNKILVKYNSKRLKTYNVEDVYWNTKLLWYKDLSCLQWKSFLSWLPSTEFNLWVAIYIRRGKGIQLLKWEKSYIQIYTNLEQRLYVFQILFRDSCRQCFLLLRHSFCHFLSFFWGILSSSLELFILLRDSFWHSFIIEPSCQSI